MFTWAAFGLRAAGSPPLLYTIDRHQRNTDDHHDGGQAVGEELRHVQTSR